jgi:uncharacterized membrane protein
MVSCPVSVRSLPKPAPNYWLLSTLRGQTLQCDTELTVQCGGDMMLRMDVPLDSERDQISQNIEAVRTHYTREERKISRSQRILERISRFVGQPAFLGFILVFVAFWMIANALLRQFGVGEFDPPPFFWLQGIVGLGALLTATVVLTKQNRLAKLAEQRELLDLKVTLLTEQKVAKLIDLLEELRRDLPNVKNRHDPEAAAMKQSMNPDRVLAALDERLSSAAEGEEVGGNV